MCLNFSTNAHPKSVQFLTTTWAENSPKQSPSGGEMGGHDTYFPVWRRVPILRFFYRKVRSLFLTLVSNREGISE